MLSGLVLNTWLWSLFLMWGEPGVGSERPPLKVAMKTGCHVGWGSPQPSDKVSVILCCPGQSALFGSNSYQVSPDTCPHPLSCYLFTTGAAQLNA